MADYINNESTLGFYKFSKDDLNTNSILNSSISDLGSSFRTPNSSSYSLTKYPNINSNTNLIKYNQKYKSRSSSLLIPESNAIYLPTENIGSSMTVEFWFYPKKGTNETDPSDDTYSPVYSATGYSANSSPLWKTSNPFLYSYEYISSSTISVPNSGKVIKAHITTGTYKNSNIYAPIWVYIGYCCYRKGFYISMFSNYEEIIGAGSMSTSSSTSTKEVSSDFFNKYPPNKWYHVAITQDNNSLAVFINGKRIFKNTISIYKSTYNYNGQRIYTTYPSFTPFNNPSMYVMSIGNRTTGTTNNVINYFPFYGKDNPNTGDYCDKPGFQDIIIDDLRVSQGILYTENFTPPGISGYQILNVDDKIYGYNDSGQFVLMDDNWSTKTNDQKKTTLDSLSLFDIELDDIKSVVNDQNNDIHIEVYGDSSTKSCKLYTDSYNETIIPSTLLQTPSEEQILKNITFTSSISMDSYIKVLVTTDLVTYKTYNFDLNSWVNTPIEDISSYGIPIDQVNNIPEEDVVLLGDKFAFAYFLHLQPYESDCSIEQLKVNVVIEYVQKHCNQSIANYEYPMFNKLKVIFYEDGEFKVNYMDKP